jgi:hypothetical protein
MSFRDKDEYRFVSEEFDILLFLFRIGAVDKDKRHSTDHENDAWTLLCKPQFRDLASLGLQIG